ncbi:hypothetical protein [Blastococcus sp. PRF04-17]|uniref:hypothetical protein n=1 Tax=Blastococcus sp. PRF04-17 TaxID=2933797 RepID=UPI001FF4993C|nr:hypothetical protein [Blastococcus sp. PRF04-17]UOY02899.1 hypothetical protein MVA48_05960 [Blastococcus sp. PRF04-17]
MILAAALMVLVGVGLFVGGVLTGVDTLYWACVVACLIAAGLLVAARRRMTAADRPSGEAASVTTAPAGSLPEVTGGATAARAPSAPPPAPETAPEELPDPPVEEVEVTDLLLVVDLKDEVLVVDEHPRYHVEGCAHLRGRTPIPLPMDEARTDGFTPCADCAPDRTMAERVRDRKAAGSG